MVPGYQRGEAVNVRYTLPVNFRMDGGPDSESQKAAGSNIAFSDDVYYVVDGVHVSAAELKKISADKINSIEVFKGESAVENLANRPRTAPLW